MGPLFRLNGNCAAALVLGLIGGYPVGAKTAAELYQKGLCSKGEAERMLGFCNNSGPAFLLGVVGVGVFGSAEVGLLLCVVHILTALLVGLLFRFYPAGKTSQAKSSHSSSERPHFAQVFTESVKNSFTSLLNVCAFVLLFGILLRLLENCGLLGVLAGLLTPLGLDGLWCQRLLGGMLELSNGVAALPADTPLVSIPMAAFLLGWGGVSVLCQTMSVVQDSGLSIQPCVVGKLLHGMLSAGLTALLLRLLPGVVETSALAGERLTQPWQPSFAATLLLSVTLAGFLFALFLRASVEQGKNKGGNRRKHRL